MNRYTEYDADGEDDGDEFPGIEPDLSLAGAFLVALSAIAAFALLWWLFR